jgi:hypothetical protein
MLNRHAFAALPASKRVHRREAREYVQQLRNVGTLHYRSHLTMRAVQVPVRFHARRNSLNQSVAFITED